ncbi:MAG: TetR/AcrR family transcriptional regulator [Solirubrobacteraceae bacterium]|nr:TetR/AcrR family transcriptional regulator [Patulibacter sp.]
MTARLSRKEQQALTRGALLESAMRVLADKGLHRASIDDIAADAGFTKGAFYANFRSKEALFLEMLDEHFAERLAAIEEVTSSGEDIAEQAARAGQDFSDALRGDPAWCRLFLEFSSHAARHEAFRIEFVARTNAICDRIAGIYERRATELGIVPVVPATDIARMTFAMANGAAIEQLLDPATPDDIFGTMLRLFFAGVLQQSPPADATG